MLVSTFPLEAIRIQMHQLFLNIISNAIKYSKKEVNPEIKVTHTDLDSILEISISDNGIGFDNHYSEKNFQTISETSSEGI